jgi:hypothetical protein
MVTARKSRALCEDLVSIACVVGLIAALVGFDREINRGAEHVLGRVHCPEEGQRYAKIYAPDPVNGGLKYSRRECLSDNHRADYVYDGKRLVKQ